jgi:hypothetical protein
LLGELPRAWMRLDEARLLARVELFERRH